MKDANLRAVRPKWVCGATEEAGEQVGDERVKFVESLKAGAEKGKKEL